MAKKGNKFKIGVLALTAVIILILGLLSLGIMKYFQPEIYFMTVTENSVQGLKVGSNVKIKGVTIGSVKSIRLSSDGVKIYITMKFDLGAFVNKSESEAHIIKHDYQEVFDKEVQPLIEKGLRCQLQYEGITGELYVNMAYFDPKKYPIPETNFPAKHPLFIPMVPTASIGTILDSLQDITKKLNTIDTSKISNNFDNLLISVTDFTNQLRGIANQNSINEMRSNIESSLNTFNQTMGSLNMLIKTIQMQPDSVLWGKAGHKVVPSLND